MNLQAVIFDIIDAELPIGEILTDTVRGIDGFGSTGIADEEASQR